MSDIEDDFFLDDDELAKDNELNEIDIARVKLLTSLAESAKAMKENINFNEQSEAIANLEIISGYVDQLVQLTTADRSMSKEEMIDLVDSVNRSTTELTFRNMKDLLPDTEEEETQSFMKSDEDNGDPNASFDF